MNLKTHIKKKRQQQSKKQPLKRDVFNQISNIVRTYGLTKQFLRDLEHPEESVLKEKAHDDRVRVKAPMEPTLFSLVTQEEYTLTLSIIRKTDNSYLAFVHSPEEILLCDPLYRLNPDLQPEKLARYHFETLFLHEQTKVDLS